MKINISAADIRNFFAKKNVLEKEELEEKLIREHYGLVISQALYFLDDSSFEDYIQAGLIGLLKAIRNYDENKAKFSTFATVCIRNEIQSLNKNIIEILYIFRNYYKLIILLMLNWL